MPAAVSESAAVRTRRSDRSAAGPASVRCSSRLDPSAWVVVADVVLLRRGSPERRSDEHETPAWPGCSPHGQVDAPASHGYARSRPSRAGSAESVSHQPCPCRRAPATQSDSGRRMTHPASNATVDPLGYRRDNGISDGSGTSVDPRRSAARCGCRRVRLGSSRRRSARRTTGRPAMAQTSGPGAARRVVAATGPHGVRLG